MSEEDHLKFEAGGDYTVTFRPISNSVRFRQRMEREKEGEEEEGKGRGRKKREEEGG